MIAEQNIKDVLASFSDPITGADLLAAGRVDAIAVTEQQAVVTLLVPQSLVDTYQPVAAALKEALQKLASGQKVQVVLTAERVGGGSAPPKAPMHGADKPVDTSRIKNIIAVGSGKGGVGKSTVAVNLAAALVSAGMRVGVMDADIYGPSIPHLLKLTDKPVLGDNKKIVPPVVNGLKAMSIGLLVDAEKALIWRGPMVQGAVMQLLRDVEWGDLDYLIIDLPPGTGDAQLTLAQRVKLSGAVIVSTPQDLALIDARKAVAMFQKLQVPILGLVENMSMFCCPQCGHETPVFGAGAVEKEAVALGVPLLGKLPLLSDVRALSDAGTPPAWHANSAIQSAYRALADAVIKQNQ